LTILSSYDIFILDKLISRDTITEVIFFPPIGKEKFLRSMRKFQSSKVVFQKDLLWRD